jgi:hypothetical protein
MLACVSLTRLIAVVLHTSFKDPAKLPHDLGVDDAAFGKFRLEQSSGASNKVNAGCAGLS